MTRKQKRLLIRIIVAAALFLAARFLPLGKPWKVAGFAAAYFTVGYDILRKAGLGIVHGRPLDECFLMSIASLGAFLLAIVSGSWDFDEGVFVMLLYQLGEFFQSYAVGKSRRSIRELMDIRPDYANIEADGTLLQVSPDTIEPGRIIVVLPGEKIPLDGTVTEGRANLNTAALTGESRPRSVAEGDAVISGCICLNSVLKIRTEKRFEESTASRILELVENAASRKAKTESFISRFARIYTPVVCAAALALAVLLPVIRILAGLPAGWSLWLYRALAFLVVSCPCALVISVPLCFFAAIGAAGNRGILIKGSNYLEALAATDCVAFDKTGTLTEGVFAVTEVIPEGVSAEEILELSAMAECASSHPISKSLQTAWGKDINRDRVAGIQEIAGRGVTAQVDGRQVAVGNRALLEELGIAAPEKALSGTVVYTAADGVYIGCILISDIVKHTARPALAALRRCGITKTVMLTGDGSSAASLAAKELGLDEVYAELLPDDKVARVEALLAEEKPGAKLAFVGDGINDAPVLARADVGIAMGALGSDAAIEAADVVLMDDNPQSIAEAIRLSRKCLRLVRQNIVFSLAIKFACLAAVAFGLAGMWAAVFADVGVMILAVLNALRVRN